MGPFLPVSIFWVARKSKNSTTADYLAIHLNFIDRNRNFSQPGTSGSVNLGNFKRRAAQGTRDGLCSRSLYGTGERATNFKNPIPVYITYQTAFVDDAGQLQTRPDIYGLDKNITNLLKGDSEVADIPISRNYSSDSKPVVAHILRRRRDEVVDEPFGWEPGWGPNYSQSGRSAYGQFDRYRFW
jgi:hypothetical protein